MPTSMTRGSRWPARPSPAPVREMAVLATDAPGTVLAVYAHPDDPDVSAGGTLARWAAAGAAVHVCICADCDKGSSDPATDPTELLARPRLEVAAPRHILADRAHSWLGARA